MISASTLRNTLVYRGFILSNVKREFVARYQNSILGAAWCVINPLAMIAVYTLIFSHLMKSRIPGIESSYGYSIYLCAGVLTWGLFAEITMRAQNVFLENANLLKKINFPRICLPIIVVANASINFAIIFGLFTLFLIASGNFPGWVFLAVVPLLLLQIVFAISLGIILGVLNVFFRDVGQFFGVALQFWFWFTPVVYPVTILPPPLQRLLELNPMAALISGYHQVLLMKTLPHWGDLTFTAALTSMLFCLALLIYRKRVGEMVDEL